MSGHPGAGETPAADLQPGAEHDLKPLAMTLTRALLRKLTQTARDEGVTPEQLAEELITEGLTLRAWEILERKSAMRGQHSGAHQGHGGHGHGHHHGQGGRRNHGGGHGNAWMEDKAAFLEYVRNQERQRRR